MTVDRFEGSTPRPWRRRTTIDDLVWLARWHVRQRVTRPISDWWWYNRPRHRSRWWPYPSWDD